MESRKTYKTTIGVTGGIGTGKTTVCKVLESLGYPVYYADEAAKNLMITDQALVYQIKAEFGTNTYSSSGSLDRVYLARAVFSNPAKLEKLNSLVHPAVAKDFQLWVSQQKSNIVFKEAALLYETGSYKSLSATILVLSPITLRLKRLLIRDKHRTKQDILNIIDRQIPDEEKEKLATYVIHNDEQQPIIKQVLSINGKLNNFHSGLSQ
jgi:dephospho-CoA kinase